jgi:hypothetical protein
MASASVEGGRVIRSATPERGCERSLESRAREESGARARAFLRGVGASVAIASGYVAVVVALRALFSLG